MAPAIRGDPLGLRIGLGRTSHHVWPAYIFDPTYSEILGRRDPHPSRALAIPLYPVFGAESDGILR